MEGSDEEREAAESSLDDGSMTVGDSTASQEGENQDDEDEDDDDERHGVDFWLVLDDLNDDQSILVDETSPVRYLEDEELDQLVCMLDDDGQDVDIVSRLSPDMDSARKAASLVSRMEGPLSLRLNLLHEPTTAEACCPFVDLFLDSMAAYSNAELHALDLPVLGRSIDSWRRFSDRFGPGIKRFTMSTISSLVTDAMASEVAKSLMSRFDSLHDLSLGGPKDETFVNSEAEKQLLRAVPNLPSLTSFTFSAGGRIDHYLRPRTIANQLDYVSEMALSCTSLKHLAVSATWISGDDNGLTHDGSIVLERMLRSTSLESLSLLGLPLTNFKYRAAQLRKAPVNNFALKRIHLTFCRLIDESLSLVGRYKGLESIQFCSNTLEAHPDVPVATVFPGLNNLVTFEDCLSGLGVTSWIGSNLRYAPSLREVTLHLEDGAAPAVRDIIVNCSADLKLGILSSRDPSVILHALCGGIEAARALPSLEFHLQHPVDQNNLASILHSVHVNLFLRRFRGQFRLSDAVDLKELEPVLEEFVATNITLDSFCLGLRTPSGDAQTDALRFVVQGLRRNRRLHAINLTRCNTFWPGLDRCPLGPVRVSGAISKEIFLMLLECNTTLLSIEGVEYESNQDEERIGSLLALNRHGKELVGGNARSVPVELWGDVLCRVSNSGCNFFVTELVRRALFGATPAEELRAQPC
jgi:hypothetical protein